MAIQSFACLHVNFLLSMRGAAAYLTLGGTPNSEPIVHLVLVWNLLHKHRKIAAFMDKTQRLVFDFWIGTFILNCEEFIQ